VAYAHIVVRSSLGHNLLSYLWYGFFTSR